MKKRWTALLLALLMTLSMLPLSAMAEENGADPMPTEEEETISSGLTLYSDEFTIENGVLLAYTGPTKVTEVTVPYGVTAIGDLVFYTKNRIMKINLPATVERIGHNAFAACYSLQEINLPEGLTYIGHHAFSDCHSLTSLKLPSTLTYIGERAFYGCSNAEGEIVIADGVTELGSYTFYNCKKITGVTLPEGLTEIPDCFFMGCEGLVRVNLPDTIERIGEYAFGYCKSLKTLDLPENLCKLGRCALQNCESLSRRLTIPDQLEEIPQRALADAGGIKELVIGKGVRVIYSAQGNGHAFYGMNSVTDVIFTGLTVPNNFPDGYEVNKDLFTFMPNLQNVWVPEEAYDAYLEVYGDRLPEGVQMLAGFPEEVDTTCGDNLEWSVENGVLTIFGTGDMYDFRANGGPWAAQRDEITSVVIEEGVTSVGNYAFSNMGKITGVTMADTVKKLGEGAFYFCGRLASVAMPGVTAIGKQAFYSCDGLTAPVFPAGLTELAEGVYGGCAGFTEITIPEGITTIGAGAFEKCANLTDVSIPASVTDIGARPFDSCTKLTYIAADEDNTAFTAEDGILFNKGKTILLQVPAGKEKADYQVPETVIEIADHAFRMSRIHAIRFAGAAPVIGDHALESAFVQLRYPYDDESWYALLEQDYGAAELTWIPYHPGYGVDLNGSRLADLRDLDFMAFSQLAYHQYTLKEQDLSIGQLIHLLKDEVWGDRDITYTELTANIGNWVVADIFEDDGKGYYAVLFRNGYGEAVLAYRGSIALTKIFSDKASEQWDAVQDWLVNDFPMELGDYLVPQIDLALETLEEVLEDFTPDKLAATGHSLGGALSNIASTYSGCRSESVNAISSLDTVYAFKPGYMGENFKGVELWDIEDHANEHDILAGVFEDTFTYRIKPYTAHQSVFSSFNLTGNHGIASMLMRNELGGLIVTPQSGSFTPDGAITSTLLSSNYVLELGTAGADSMNAYSAQVLHHALYGGSGKDKLIGSMVADQLIGGPGNDSLDGGYGDDTYHYFKGHGTDTIHDVGGFDELCLYGFAAKEIGISSNGEYVEIRHNDQVIARIGRGSRSGRASDFSLVVYKEYGPDNIPDTYSLGDYFDASFSQRVAVGCPVDIEVLDSEGHVVYTVEDGTEGEYYTPYGSFYVYEEENGEYGKILDLKEGYTIRIRGLDEGTMEITHWTADGDELTENGGAAEIPVREGFAAALTTDDLGVLSLTDDRGEEHPLIGGSDGEEVRDMEYTLHSLLVYTKEGVLSEIPTGPFNVSINMQNHASVTTDTLLLVLYDAEGRMIDLVGQPLTVKAGGTARPVLTLDNSDGEIAMIRAMVVTRGGNLVPLSNAMTAGSILENLPEVPVVPEVPGVPEVPLGD